jgi:putative redox protein
MDLITVTRRSGLEFKVAVREHAFTSDMAPGDGGTDAGMAPAELLAASLGACVAMMAQAYCRKHGWDGDAGASLTLELADNPKRVAAIVVDLELPDGVPDDKKETVRTVAERCLVEQTFRHPPAVDVEVA